MGARRQQRRRRQKREYGVRTKTPGQHCDVQRLQQRSPDELSSKWRRLVSHDGQWNLEPPTGGYYGMHVIFGEFLDPSPE
jgi:hypothetical protein